MSVLMLNFKQSDTREQDVYTIFPNGVPANDAAVLSVVETYFDLRSGELRGYRVTREGNGNVLIRPNAVFGKLVSDEAYRQRGIEAIIFLQNMVGVKETKKTASKGWDKMSPSEQTQTLMAYNAMKSK